MDEDDRKVLIDLVIAEIDRFENLTDQYIDDKLLDEFEQFDAVVQDNGAQLHQLRRLKAELEGR